MLLRDHYYSANKWSNNIITSEAPTKEEVCVFARTPTFVRLSVCYPDTPLEFGKIVGGGGLGCVLPPQKKGACIKLWLPFDIPGYVHA